jgi:hypothetical protein
MLMLVMLAMVAWLTRRTSLATHEPCEEALPIVVVEPITTRRRSTRAHAHETRARRKAMRDAIEDFCDEGNDEVMRWCSRTLTTFDRRAARVPARRLARRVRARHGASISLPAVLS